MAERPLDYGEGIVRRRPLQDLTAGGVWDAFLNKGESIGRELTDVYEKMAMTGGQGLTRLFPQLLMSRSLRERLTPPAAPSPDERASVRAAPFAQESDDVGTKVGATVLDPTNVIGAGVGAVTKVGRKVARTVGEKIAEMVGEKAAPKVAGKVAAEVVKEGPVLKAARELAEKEPAVIAPEKIEATTDTLRKGVQNPKAGALVNLKLREMSPQDAMAAAKRGEHLVPKVEGGFVGGPRKVQTQADLDANRLRMDQELAAAREEQQRVLGPDYADWYESQRRGIAEMANKYQQPRAAQGEALMSPVTDPHGELGFHLKAHNRVALDKPVGIAHTGRQGAEYERAATTGTPIRQGEKTGMYAVSSDPTQPMPNFGTNDFRQAQKHGYTDVKGKPQTQGLATTQHAFLDAENLLLADRAGMQPHHTQEIPWVASKADALMKMRPTLTREQALREAAKTIEDHLPAYSFSPTYERVPGAKTGHGTSIVTAPTEDQVKYGARGGWINPETGRDVNYEALNFLQRPTRTGVGNYDGLFGQPVYIPPVMTHLVENKNVGRTIAPEMLKTVRGVERFRGAMDAQEMVAGHMPFGQSTRNAGTKQHGFIPLKQQATADQLRRIGGLLPDGWFATPSADGVMLLGPGGKAAKVDKLMQFLTPQVKEVFGVGASRVGKEGFYDPVFLQRAGGKATPQGEGVVTSRVLRDMADLPPNVAQGLSESPGVRGAIRETRKRDKETLPPSEQRADIDKMRQFFSEEDWSKVVDLMRRGMKPAAAMGALGFSLKGMAAEEAR